MRKFLKIFKVIGILIDHIDDIENIIKALAGALKQQKDVPFNVKDLKPGDFN